MICSVDDMGFCSIHLIQGEYRTINGTRYCENGLIDIQDKKVYSLKKDHQALKKHIKDWEIEIDGIMEKYRLANKGNEFEGLVVQIQNDLSGITEEMMSINI